MGFRYHTLSDLRQHKTSVKINLMALVVGVDMGRQQILVRDETVPYMFKIISSDKLDEANHPKPGDILVARQVQLATRQPGQMMPKYGLIKDGRFYNTIEPFQTVSDNLRLHHYLWPSDLMKVSESEVKRYHELSRFQTTLIVPDYQLSALPERSDNLIVCGQVRQKESKITGRSSAAAIQKMYLAFYDGTTPSRPVTCPLIGSCFPHLISREQIPHWREDMRPQCVYVEVDAYDVQVRSIQLGDLVCLFGVVFDGTSMRYHRRLGDSAPALYIVERNSYLWNTLTEQIFPLDHDRPDDQQSDSLNSDEATEIYANAMDSPPQPSHSNQVEQPSLHKPAQSNTTRQQLDHFNPLAPSPRKRARIAFDKVGPQTSTPKSTRKPRETKKPQQQSISDQVSSPTTIAVPATNTQQLSKPSLSPPPPPQHRSAQSFSIAAIMSRLASYAKNRANVTQEISRPRKVTAANHIFPHYRITRLPKTYMNVKQMQAHTDVDKVFAVRGVLTMYYPNEKQLQDLIRIECNQVDCGFRACISQMITKSFEEFLGNCRNPGMPFKRLACPKCGNPVLFEFVVYMMIKSACGSTFAAELRDIPANLLFGTTPQQVLRYEKHEQQLVRILSSVASHPNALAENLNWVLRKINVPTNVQGNNQIQSALRIVTVTLPVTSQKPMTN